MLTHQFNPYSACTSILVGKNASADGSTMIGRNEDSRAAWAKKMIIHAHREFEEPQTFKSQDQTHPFTMALPKIRAKYTATPEWTAEYGLFEEDGINEYGVAMSATESAYCNTRVLAADPYVKDGIGEEAMVTVTLPYIHSAREGVERLGHIIEEHGTYETNGILFSDVNEVGTWKLVLVITGSHNESRMMPMQSLLTSLQSKKSTLVTMTIIFMLKTFVILY
ncbi:putative dipeptidase [Lactiplantibacillus plantarum]|nr:C69 family dipeptidase [Lactiplantibacillus plantarum]OUT03822.1 putative dipeptidase [Lactiplantibacillus plantarum]